ncbi:uncharacterized protein ACA1_042560, partial [Acanthamoeba castellanii str. Neff]
TRGSLRSTIERLGGASSPKPRSSRVMVKWVTPRGTRPRKYWPGGSVSWLSRGTPFSSRVTSTVGEGDGEGKLEGVEEGDGDGKLEGVEEGDGEPEGVAEGVAELEGDDDGEREPEGVAEG